MRKTKIALAYLTITFILFGGLLCSLHDVTKQDRFTSTVMDIAEVIAEALKEEYTYIYACPNGIHLYINKNKNNYMCNSYTLLRTT